MPRERITRRRKDIPRVLREKNKVTGERLHLTEPGKKQRKKDKNVH